MILQIRLKGPSVTVVFWSLDADGMDIQVWHEGIELKVTDAAQKGATLAFAESASVSVGRDGWILLAARFLPGKKWMLLRGHILFKAFVFFYLQILNQVNGLDDVSFSNTFGDL